jgi:hypothetical protein
MSGIGDVDRLRIFRIELRALRGVVARNAACARASRCQHFLKREAVFFDALVYSRGSAFRFPNARSD